MTSRIPDFGEHLQAEIMARRGWLYYKNIKENNLEAAKKELMAAVSKDPNAEYHLHLAYVYKTLSEETTSTEQKRHKQFAAAHCNLALEMAPSEEVARRAELLHPDIGKL
jgi:uncharacterized protein HemY